MSSIPPPWQEDKKPETPPGYPKGDIKEAEELIDKPATSENMNQEIEPFIPE